MQLDYENIKKKYIKYFNFNDHYCDRVLADIVFGFTEISDFIKENKVSTVLEVGSGTGILLNELKNHFPKIKFSGIDPNVSGFYNREEIIDNLNKDGHKIKVENIGIKDYETNEKFDLIFSVNVFEHVEHQHEYLLKSYSLLNKNGKSIILCPNYDFPYEPHFVLPIIFNKNITKFIFKSKIKKFEEKENEIGLWEGISLLGRKEIEKYLVKQNIDYILDESIKTRMLKRLETDVSFKKRQGIAGIIAKICKLLFIDRLIFDFIKVPFPYMKLIIKKK